MCLKCANLMCCRLTALSSAGEEEAGSKSPAAAVTPSPAAPVVRPPLYDYEARVRHVPGMAKKKGYTVPVGKGPSSLFLFKERNVVRRITRFIIEWPYPFFAISTSYACLSVLYVFEE
ncbi:hypothetical protein CDAR_434781 [Caerostris darwini]|uniref:Uncharacterized protein n=1 Tax=Caerostris darwini TaxID=1538125 RepID=A0AAV4QEI8_9ARAC|nr:hypothetical protein CDAR_434781 [Caerostris darwini]